MLRHRGQVADTGMTTPDAPSIHRALRQMVDAGVTTAVMEVTSHGIALKRVAGLTFEVGALTNLVPDEHLDFHGTAEHYLRTKARFFDMLQPGAPLVVSRDDAHVSDLVAEAGIAEIRPVIGVSARGDPEADVGVSGLRCDGAGSVAALRSAACRSRRAAICHRVRWCCRCSDHRCRTAVAAVVARCPGGAPAGILNRSWAAPIQRRMEIVTGSHPRSSTTPWAIPISGRGVCNRR
jgi:UDP-N-acetylmuramoylalanine-D-glutamate ligase